MRIKKCKPINHENITELKNPTELVAYIHQAKLAKIIKDVFEDGYITKETEQNQMVKVVSKMWILSSAVGSGKTFMILLFLHHSRNPKVNHERELGSYAFGKINVKLQINPQTLSTDLIIIPHTLFQQWFEEVQRFDELKHDVIFVKYRSHAKHLNKEKVMNKILIIKDTMVSDLTLSLENFKFRTIFIDEPQSVKLSLNTFELLNTEFLLWICATPSILMYRYSRLITYFFGSHHLRPDIFSYISLNLDQKYIDESLNLAPYEEKQIHCSPNIHMEELVKYLPKRIAFGLMANDDSYIQLASNIASEDIVIYNVLECYKNSIKYQEAKVVFLNELISNFNEEDNSSACLEYENERKEVLTLIDDLKLKCTNIQRIVKSMINSNCVICLDNMHSLQSVLPCSHVFCTNCVLQLRNNKCPLCRLTFQLKDIHTIQSKEDKIDNIENLGEDEVVHKMLRLLSILKKNAKRDDVRTLVMVRCQKFAKKVEKFVNAHNIKTSQLFGRSEVVENIKAQFQRGEVKTLILSDLKCASGTNLQMTTHVVLFSKLNKDVQAQVIGRAWRPGRTTPLKVLSLVYPYELLESSESFV